MTVLLPARKLPAAEPLRAVAPGPGPHRADLQGLRAVAVLMVLLYHVGLGPSGGFIGVDVFFVLSGFLITGLLVREHERTGRISLPGFWARRARRLLPAAVLVLVTTCVLSRWYLPAARWPSIGGDAIAAAGYALNWRLAGQSVDYLSEGAAAGPLQHFWSLAIEEQFYVAWPLLIGLALLARTRRIAALAVGLVIAGSLGLALFTSGPQTYFTTQTRVWELAAGALCALLGSPRRSAAPAELPEEAESRPQQALAAGLSWTGLALLGTALLVVTPATRWPGPLTVLVVAATLLLILGGRAPRGARVLIATPVLTWIGDISYALYLWHWPLVVLAARNGATSTLEGVEVAVASVVLAAATYYLVERPLRSARFWAVPWRSLVGGLILTLVVTGAGTALSRAESVPDPTGPIGADLPVVVQPKATALAPRPERAKDDSGDIYARGCPSNYVEARVKPCVFDYRTTPEGPVVVGVGDSKMGQWMPALQEIARSRHWELISITKAGCPFSDIHRIQAGKEYTSCVTWNRSVVQRVQDLAPDLLFTTELDFYPTLKNGKALQGEENRQEMIRGLSSRLTAMKQAGIPMVTIAETPRMGQDMADCVSLHLDHLSSCARSRSKALQGAGIIAAAARPSGTPVLDLTDQLCTAKKCPAVTGNVLVYRDDHHLTATYARTLAPFLEQDLARALGVGEQRRRLLGN